MFFWEYLMELSRFIYTRSFMLSIHRWSRFFFFYLLIFKIQLLQTSKFVKFIVIIFFF